MRAAPGIVVAALAGLWACDPSISAPVGGAGLSLVLPASAVGLDSGHILLGGPTNRTVKVVPPATVTIDGLLPGSYTVSLEGFANDIVDRFFQATGVSVAVGRNTSVTVTAAQFASFMPSQVTAPASATGKSFSVSYQSVAGAMRYEAQAATEPSFATIKGSGQAGSSETSIPITVSDYGTYYVRVRAIDPNQSAGRWAGALGSTAVLCDCWTPQAPMPTARTGLGVGAIGGVLYAVGGSSAYGDYPAVEAFTSATSTWTTKLLMPTARARLGVAVVNGTLYAVGGYNNSGVGRDLTTVEAYDPTTNTWTAKAPMPTARSGLGVAAVNGVVYAVGGLYSAGMGTVFDTVEAYNPATNTWTLKASMPTARYDLGVTVINGVLYAVGGSNSSGFLATVEAYDPATNAWTTKAPMPTARSGLGVTVVNGLLYAVGGSNSSGFLATVEAYDPATNTWTSKASVPTRRSGVGVAVINGELYAVGGGNTAGALATSEGYQP